MHILDQMSCLRREKIWTVPLLKLFGWTFFLPKSKPILVGICYRPPDQNDFYERLDEILSVSNFNIGQEMIITGDINNYRNFWANYNMHVKGKICKITLLKYPKKH